MTFSERYGFKPEKAIQIDDMDDSLRNSLWNCLRPYFQRLDSKPAPDRTLRNGRTYLNLLAEHIWVNILKKPGDELEPKYKNLVIQLKGYFMGCTWYEAYDFIESVARVSSNSKVLSETGWLPEFVKACNDVLKNDRSAYRFVDMEIVPITSEHEIAGIEEALAATAALDTLHSVNAQLKQALALLSNRTVPDYRNSIKESISAVEGICKRIANMPDATLGQVLPVIQRPGHAMMPAHLQAGIRSLWGYTNGPDGIRHAMMQEPTIDIEEARLMLVTCAALVSYLIEKARKAGIAL